MKVWVHRTVTVPVSPMCNVHYRAGFRGTAPRAHITKIVAARAGSKVSTSPPEAVKSGGEARSDP